MAIDVNKYTRQRMRDYGYCIANLQTYSSFSKRSTDAFGFIDYLGVGHRGILALQTTSRANLADRTTKILHECTDVAKLWLANCGRIEVWGWAKQKHKMVLKRIAIKLDADNELQVVDIEDEWQDQRKLAQ